MKLTRILEFLQDESRMFSATRLVFLLWNFAAISIVIYTLVVFKTVPKLDMSIVGILATVMGGKVVQSFSENNSDTHDKSQG